MLKSVQWHVVTCFAIALAGAGCVAPYPYSNPYGGYPGAYGSPATMPGMYAPAPTLNAPTGSNTFTPVPLNSSATNSGTNDAPMFDADSTDSKKVPTYPDPGDISAPNETKMFDNEKEPFKVNDIPKRRSQNSAYDTEFADAASEPPILKLSGERPATTAETKSAPVDEFVQPIESFADADELKVPYEEDQLEIPYGHDAEGYRYLRGLAVYDTRTDSWSIIYNNKPGRDDQFGGVLTLADHEGFGVLNDKDVIHVSGSVSSTEQDEFGKAKYIVSELHKLQPISKK